MMRTWSWLGIVILGGIACTWLVSLIVGFDVVADVDPSRANALPAWSYWLGTDHLGRDVFWRLITASEAFVGPGLVACAVAACTGIWAGAISGYRGGAWSYTIRYLFNVIASIPRFVLVLLVCSIYGSDPMVLALATGTAYAPGVASAVHGRIETLRNADFVIAARAHGLSPMRIVCRHLLWVNCRRLVGRQLLQLFGFYVVLESTLSYIGGFGIVEPNPSWGNMLAFEFGIHDGNPLAVIAPTIAIWLAVLGTILAGEALQEPGRG